MTPAIEAARKAAIVSKTHEYEHDPRTASYGTEAAQQLGIAPERVFKTLLVALDGDDKRLAVGVVPVNKQLDLKAMAKACGAKKATMAKPGDAQRATGYLVGGISPLAQKRRLPLRLDASALVYATIYASAGRRGLEIELAPGDLLALTRGEPAPIAREQDGASG